MTKDKPYIVTKKYVIYNPCTCKKDEIVTRHGYYTSRSGKKRVINLLCNKYFNPYFHAVTNEPMNLGEMCSRAATMRNDDEVMRCIEEYVYFGTGAFLADKEYQSMHPAAKQELFNDWKKKTKYYGQLKEELQNQLLDDCQYLEVYADRFKAGKYSVSESSIESSVTEHIEDFKEKFNNNYENDDVILIIKNDEQDQM